MATGWYLEWCRPKISKQNLFKVTGFDIAADEVKQYGVAAVHRRIVSGCEGKLLPPIQPSIKMVESHLARKRVMSNSVSDRNLLLGLLALQFGLVTDEQLVEAVTAWGRDRTQPLDEIFVRLKFLGDDCLKKLQTLLEMHLQMHAGDVEQSLAALSSISEVKNKLRAVHDVDLEQSLQHLSQRPAEEADLYRTQSFDNAAAIAASVGEASSKGLRFRILRLHARGGLGEVSVALDSELNREVALKEIQRKHADLSESRSRFMLEAQITGGLEHPGIVPVYGMGTYADGRPFYAMRFIRGDSLKDGIKNFFRKYAPSGDAKASQNAKESNANLPPKLHRAAYESLDFRQLLGRFVDVCNAIAYAHARGVLHRDLKPGNIMLGNYGETLVVDWGLAKATGKADESLDTTQLPLTASTDSASAETMFGSTLGTPAYMSPEQASGRIDLFSPATDVYSLGATLYHLLTGCPPHSGTEVADILKRVQSGDFITPRKFNRAVPSALNAICLKAMEVNPKLRYQLALDLAADIDHWMADQPVAAMPDGIFRKLARWGRRHPALGVSISLCAVCDILFALSYCVYYNAEFKDGEINSNYLGYVALALSILFLQLIIIAFTAQFGAITGGAAGALLLGLIRIWRRSFSESLAIGAKAGFKVGGMIGICVGLAFPVFGYFLLDLVSGPIQFWGAIVLSGTTTSIGGAIFGSFVGFLVGGLKGRKSDLTTTVSRFAICFATIFFLVGVLAVCIIWNLSGPYK